jgi:hypothetical protein
MKIFRTITEQWTIVGEMPEAFASIAARCAEVAPEVIVRASVEEIIRYASDVGQSEPTKQSAWEISLTYTTWTPTTQKGDE